MALPWRPPAPFPNRCSLAPAGLPANGDYAHKVKCDGFRAIVSTEGALCVRSRRGCGMTEHVGFLVQLPVRARPSTASSKALLREAAAQPLRAGRARRSHAQGTSSADQQPERKQGASSKRSSVDCTQICLACR
jgi:hypothetical protein